MKNILLYAVLILFFCSCDSKPKIIVEDTASVPTEEGATKNVTKPLEQDGSGGMHQVEAVEIMQAEKYTYLRVVENRDTFWIASSKFEAKKGNRYFYKGGLLKTNFQSQEFNRVFDKIYLVSSIIDASQHPGNTASTNDPDIPNLKVEQASIKNIQGRIKLAELFGKKLKYAGQTIIVAGKCVKVNNGIMGRNWIHIQDGTEEKGKPCDLTVTTNENIALGSNVAFEGKIALNKDFGAGYRYDIIMEEAAVKENL